MNNMQQMKKSQPIISLMVSIFSIIAYSASLVENTTAITNAAKEIDAAIVAKGGSTVGGLTNAAAAIASIPSGGGIAWTKPDDWPDIKAILAANTDDYKHKMIFLFLERNLKLKLNGAQKWRLDDGRLANSNEEITLTETGNYRWAIGLTNNDYFEWSPNYVLNTWQYVETAQYHIFLLWVYCPATIRPARGWYWCGNFKQLQCVEFEKLYPNDDHQVFVDCPALVSIVGDIDFSNSKCAFTSPSYASMKSLRDVGNISWGNVKSFTGQLGNFIYDAPFMSLDYSDFIITNALSFYIYNGQSIKGLPGSMDLSLIGGNNPFGELLSLEKFPTNLQINVNFSFAAVGSKVKDWSTLAKFDASDNIIGGLVYNLNSVATAKTMTISPDVAFYHFTKNQRTKITQMLSSKNWTLSAGAGWTINE